MDVPRYLDQGIRDAFPESLTILPTYRCNAECSECCFESNPRIRGRLSLDTIKQRITEAHEAFPNLKLIVFSGGEAFLLKDDLFAAIAHANQLGLSTRCVTNAFWGKTPRSARATVDKLVAAGINEVNISTGADHQEWVPFSSVENAIQALTDAGVFTLVTIEKDGSGTNCYGHAMASPLVMRLLREEPLKFSLQCNSWMPFHENYQDRGEPAGLSALTTGCTQVFHNLVVTPHDQLAACCGLTFEHIPEMKLGSLGAASMSSMFDEALRDFLKIWIHLDGPGNILRRLFGDDIDEELRHIRHICQACSVLHLHPVVRAELQKRYQEFVPDVLSRFNLKMAVHRREVQALRQAASPAQAAVH
jgi:hypothetical protein